MLTDRTGRTIAVLWLGTWAAFLCVGIPLAVLPRYVHSELGLGDAAAGFAVGALSLAAMLGRPFGGRLADERSRRLVVTTGLALCTIGGAGMIVGAGTYWSLILARMVSGAGEAWVYVAAMAWALDLTPQERHGRAISLFGMAIWLGASVGTALGELLHTATGSYSAIWLAVTLIPLSGLVLVLTTREPARPPHPRERAPLILRASVRPGLGLTAANVGYGTLTSLVTLHLAARGVGSPGLVLTAVAGAVVVARLLVAAALDRTGPWPVLVAGCVAQAAGLVLIALAHTLAPAIVGGLLLGVGYAAVFPALALMVVERTPAEQRGAALGGFTAFLDLGLAIGAPLAGLMAGLAGRPGALAIGGGLTLLAIAVAPRGGRPAGPGELVPAECERL